MIGDRSTSTRPRPTVLARLLAVTAVLLAAVMGSGALASAGAATPSKTTQVQWRTNVDSAVSGVIQGHACKVVVAGAAQVRSVKFTLTSASGRSVSARGKRLGGATSPIFTCRVNTRKLPDGPVEVTATATSTGGETASATQEIVVDNSGKPVNSISGATSVGGAATEATATTKPTEPVKTPPVVTPPVEPTPPVTAPPTEPTPPVVTPPTEPTPPVTTPPSTQTNGWFAPTSIWNRSFSGESPLASNSAGYVSELVRQVNSAGPWINTDTYSTPVYTVPANQPTVRVKIVREDGGWVDPNLAAAFSAVPLPSNAQPAKGSDGHLVVWQPSTDKMWEFWRMRYEGGSWVASHGGAMQNVSENPGYYNSSAWNGAQTYWGATATALPLVGGLMTMKELSERKIPHALALAIPEPGSSYVWPAQRSDGWKSGSSAIPEGTIFRLPASLNLASLHLSPTTLAIAEAAQRYGMVVRDTSGCVSLYGEDPTPTGASYSAAFEHQYPNSLLKAFPWSKLVAVAPGT
jgi:hypothetical protein